MNKSGLGLLDILIATALLALALTLATVSLSRSGQSQLKAAYSATLDTSLRYLEDDLSSSQTHFADPTPGKIRTVSGVEMLEYAQSQSQTLARPDGFEASVVWTPATASPLGYQNLANYTVKACLFESCKTRKFAASIPVYVQPSTVARSNTLTVDVDAPSGITPKVKIVTAEPHTYELSSQGRTRLTFDAPTDAVVTAEAANTDDGLSAQAVVSRTSSSSFRVHYSLSAGWVTLTSSGGVTFTGTNTTSHEMHRFTGPGRFVLGIGEYSVSPDPVSGMTTTATPDRIVLRGGETQALSVRSSVTLGSISVTLLGARGLKPVITVSGGGTSYNQIGEGVLSVAPGRYSVQAERLAKLPEPVITPSSLSVESERQTQVTVDYASSGGEETNLTGYVQLGSSGLLAPTRLVGADGVRIPLVRGLNEVRVGRYQVVAPVGFTAYPSQIDVTSQGVSLVRLSRP